MKKIIITGAITLGVLGFFNAGKDSVYATTDKTSNQQNNNVVTQTQQYCNIGHENCNLTHESNTSNTQYYNAKHKNHNLIHENNHNNGQHHNNDGNGFHHNTW